MDKLPGKRRILFLAILIGGGVLIHPCPAVSQPKPTATNKHILRRTHLNKPTMGMIITHQQTEELIRKHKPKAMAKKLADLIGVRQAYILRDTRIIALPEHGDPILYNFDEVGEVIQKVLNQPLTKEFLLEIPAQAAQVSTLLNIPAAQLDNTLESLSLVDKALRKIGINKANEYQLIGPLTAYCGQVMIHVKGGHWELRQENSDDPQLLVIAPDGSTYNSYHWVTKIFSSGSNSFSFHAAITHELGLNPIKLQLFDPPVGDMRPKPED